MEATPPANQTSVAEKMRDMEALWAGSSQNEAQFESPVWHGDTLRDREENITIFLELTGMQIQRVVSVI
ncbi:MAG: hypothetical protein WBN75_15820 [Verrucomicrobiia bacterium]